MHNSLLKAACAIVPKTCVQAVAELRVPTRKPSMLSTWAASGIKAKWKVLPLTPTALHKFVMQFYTLKIRHVSSVSGEFSPLSTLLIIRSMQVKEENLLIGHGG